jgi:hypothetical protein
MKRSDMLRLSECAQYLVDTERDDFENYVLEGNDPFCHIFSTAYIALHGLSQFETLVIGLNNDFKDAGVLK